MVDLRLRELEDADLDAVQRDAADPALAHLGHIADPRCWGRGVATSAARALLRLARSELGATRVQATCRPEHAASAAALRRAGLRETGLLRDHVVVRGRPADSLLPSWEDR